MTDPVDPQPRRDQIRAEMADQSIGVEITDWEIDTNDDPGVWALIKHRVELSGGTI